MKAPPHELDKFEPGIEAKLFNGKPESPKLFSVTVRSCFRKKRPVLKVAAAGSRRNRYQKETEKCLPEQFSWKPERVSRWCGVKMN